MQIDRAKQLAVENGFTLKPGASQWVWDLRRDGDYIDTLATDQILHLKEEDYVEFYLSD